MGNLLVVSPSSVGTTNTLWQIVAVTGGLMAHWFKGTPQLSIAGKIHPHVHLVNVMEGKGPDRSNELIRSRPSKVLIEPFCAHPCVATTFPAPVPVHAVGGLGHRPLRSNNIRVVICGSYHQYVVSQLCAVCPLRPR